LIGLFERDGLTCSQAPRRSVKAGRNGRIFFGSGRRYVADLLPPGADVLAIVDAMGQVVKVGV
jgi:hypothetical protein